MAELKIDLDGDITVAAKSDWAQVASITAEAFADDPVNQWIFGTQSAIKACFEIMARDIYGQKGLCHLAEDFGATMWALPGQKTNLSIIAKLRFALAIAFKGRRGSLDRATRLAALMEKYHPKEPHAYLFTVGTRRSGRGKGYGKALLTPVLEACDRASLPVYLENSNPVNTGFYRSQGFESLGTFNVGKGGPVMEPMWRAPLDVVTDLAAP
ncbi:MAG: GNAT family N-acetyltransferase [Pseudomonadota bacterium]